MIAARQIAFGKAAGKRKPYDAEIEFLESTGTQWIDTGIVPVNALSYEICAAVTTYNVGDVIAGGRGSTGTENQRILEHERSGSVILCIQRGSFNILLTIPFDTDFHTYYSSASQLRIDSASASSQDADDAESTAKFALFGQSIDGADAVSIPYAKIRYAKFWLNGLIVLDLIPVRKGNIGYMYDRVSGQLFGNQGTGEFVLGADINQDEVDYTAKDYVQDGLVAMWDGIENAGWGVHDPSATVWKDLVGDNDITLDRIHQTITNNSVVFNKSSHGGKLSKDITDIVALDFCGMVTDNAASTIFAANSISTEGVSNGCYLFILWYLNGAVSAGDRKKGFEVGINNAFTIYADYTTDALYFQPKALNGKTETPTGGIDYYQIKGGNVIGFSPRPDYPFAGVANCLRIYNRALTAEEIAHNYEIDRVRFNLP